MQHRGRYWISTKKGIDSSAIINSYRGAGGAGQKSRQIRHELTKIINKANIGFRSRWLEKYEEALQKEDNFAKRTKGINYYLDKDESESIEFKTTLLLDVNRLLKGDGKMEENDNVLESVLKTIVGFLNTKGGEVVIGILEKSRFETIYEEKLLDCPIYNDKIIFGIANEYRKDEWDGYKRRLLSLIEERISADIIDTELVRIQKDSYEDKDLCLISIAPADAKQYLQNKFFIRRGNKTVLLEGSNIDRYWSKRTV